MVVSASHQVSQGGGIALLKVGELSDHWANSQSAKVCATENLPPPSFPPHYELTASKLGYGMVVV